MTNENMMFMYIYTVPYLCYLGLPGSHYHFAGGLQSRASVHLFALVPLWT